MKAKIRSPSFVRIHPDEAINFSEYLQREGEFSVSSDDNFLLNGFLVDLCMCWLSSPSICIRFHWLRSFLMQLSFLLGTYHLYAVVLKECVASMSCVLLFNSFLTTLPFHMHGTLKVDFSVA